MKTFLSVALVCMTTWAALAFSAYENYLLSGEMRHAALTAQVKEGRLEDLKAALPQLRERRSARYLRSANIDNLSIYSRELTDGTEWLMIYFEYDGDDYLQAAADFESATADFTELYELTIRHERAERYGLHLLQMEWICFIRGSNSEAEGERIAMATRLKPEKEMDYRLYHQAVWPGVVDQMARGNNRNFSIFLVEIGEEIYKFFYTEYCGEDSEADGAMNAADPSNQRWWQHTDPCQDPIEDIGGKWVPMRRLL